MKRLLLHPSATLASLIVGLTALAALCGSVAAALSPLAAVDGLGFIKKYVVAIVTICGAVSALCLALAAVGRSIAPYIDRGGKPPDSGTPVVDSSSARVFVNGAQVGGNPRTFGSSVAYSYVWPAA